MTLTTRLCRLLQIENPITQGPLGGPFGVSTDLIAAVCNAGAFGSIATAFRTPGQVIDEIRRVREPAGSRPFAVNVRGGLWTRTFLPSFSRSGLPSCRWRLGLPGTRWNEPTAPAACSSNR